MSHKPTRAVAIAAVHINESRSTALTSITLAFICSLLFVLVAGAQTVAGTVSDAAGKPIQNATVALIEPGARDTLFTQLRTNALGRFVITTQKGGDYRLRATGSGYRSVASQPMKLEAAQVTMMEIVLVDTAAVAGENSGSMQLVAQRRLSHRELLSPLGFDIRRAGAVGAFVGQEELQKYGRLPFESILRDNASRLSLEIAVDRTFLNEVILMRQGTGACLPEVRLDGSSLGGVRGTTISRLSGYAANQIYGVEVYRSSQLPSPRVAGDIGTSAPDCGVIAIWTNAQQIQTAHQLWQGGLQR